MPHRWNQQKCPSQVQIPNKSTFPSCSCRVGVNSDEEEEPKYISVSTVGFLSLDALGHVSESAQTLRLFLTASIIFEACLT